MFFPFKFLVVIRGNMPSIENVKNIQQFIYFFVCKLSCSIEEEEEEEGTNFHPF